MLSTGLHFASESTDWSQEVLLRQVRTFVLPAIEKSGGVRAWIVDDTGFPKKGVHSVGVARQRSTRSAPRAPRACRKGWCWRTPVTGSTRHYVTQ